MHETKPEAAPRASDEELIKLGREVLVIEAAAVADAREVALVDDTSLVDAEVCNCTRVLANASSTLSLILLAWLTCCVESCVADACTCSLACAVCVCTLFCSACIMAP